MASHISTKNFYNNCFEIRVVPCAGRKLVNVCCELCDWVSAHFATFVVSRATGSVYISQHLLSCRSAYTAQLIRFN